MKRFLFAGVVAAPLMAFAQGAVIKPTTPPPSTVVEPVLNCPTGTTQAGGRQTQFEAVFCVKQGSMHEVVFHGPYLGVYENGKKRVEGGYINGQKNGLWVSFDQAGNKIEELTFVNTQWHGARTMWVNGKKTVEENWVNGKQDGVQKYWDAAGKLTQQTFRNGTQVANK